MKQEWIDFALKTWYPKDHHLHYDLQPSLMGLAGEAGELIDLHKKRLYKEGFEYSREKELDELGDLWYYLRILVYQSDFRLELIGLENTVKSGNFEIALLVTIISQESVKMLKETITLAENSTLDDLWYTFPFQSIAIVYHALSVRLFQLNCTLEELTALNWAKLSGGKHGWKEAKDY